MTLTQQQIGEAGEAFNDAMGLGVISTALRGRLVVDLHSAAQAVGDAELIAGAKVVRGDARTKAAYIQALDAYIAILTGSSAVAPVTTAPVVVAPVPPSSAGTVLGLSASQLSRMTTVCNASPILAWAREYAAIKFDLMATPPVYDYANADKIEALKEVFYGDVGFKNDAAIEAYLNIVDQRDSGNQPLPKGDPRWKYVSGAGVSVPIAPAPVIVNPAPVVSAPIPSGDIAAIVAALAATYNIYISRNVISVGLPPDAESRAGVQVGGEAEAEVLGISNTRGTDGQNPGEVHKNTLSIAANDGGMRAIQYGNWGVNGLKRNTTNRNMTIKAFMDSMGEACISQDPQTATETGSVQLSANGRLYGQLYYERIDWARKKIVLVAFQPGWTVEIAGSSAYGDGTVKQL